MQSQAAEKEVALYHVVKATDGFEESAQALFNLVRAAEERYPGRARRLHLDIVGHRNAAGGYDHDMHELQQGFLAGFLGQFLTRVRMPLLEFVPRGGQRNDVPPALELLPAPSPRVVEERPIRVEIDSPDLAAAPVALKYHCDRLRRQYPFFAGLTTGIGAEASTADEIPQDYLARYQEALIPSLREALQRGAVDENVLQRDDSLLTVGSVMYRVAGFAAMGRNIFDFAPELVAMFRNTEVGALPVTAFKIPYRHLYLYFGPQPDMQLGSSGHVFDGAYVRELSGGCGLEITLCTVRPSAAPGERWWDHPDLSFTTCLPIDSPTRTVAVAVEQVLARQLTVPAVTGGDGPASVAARAAVAGEPAPTNRERLLKHFETGYALYRDSLCLVINALCYISRYREEIEAAWPEQTPAGLLKKALSAPSAKERTRAHSKLASQGYGMVNFCGRMLQRQVEAAAVSRGPMAMHWRRGHWRNQPCGVGRSEHRLRWIMPVLVKAEPHGAVRGKVYRCGSGAVGPAVPGGNAPE